MCWFHTWQITKQGPVVVTVRDLSHSGNRDLPGVGIIKECSKCGTERGFIELHDQPIVEISPDFIRPMLPEYTDFNRIVAVNHVAVKKV